MCAPYLAYASSRYSATHSLGHEHTHNSRSQIIILFFFVVVTIVGTILHHIIPNEMHLARQGFAVLRSQSRVQRNSMLSAFFSSGSQDLESLLGTATASVRVHGPLFVMCAHTKMIKMIQSKAHVEVSRSRTHTHTHTHTQANIANAQDDIEKIKDHNITTLSALKSMTVDDYNHIGVSVGTRIAIIQALEDEEANAHKITRSASYSGKDRKMRPM